VDRAVVVVDFVVGSAGTVFVNGSLGRQLPASHDFAEECRLIGSWRRWVYEHCLAKQAPLASLFYNTVDTVSELPSFGIDCSVLQE
jgi:hypothetical protein